MPLMQHYILDADGEAIPADFLTWVRWFETADRVLAQDRDESGQTPILVSTVFLGVDHNFRRDGPPVLWETMIFRDNKSDDVYCERYTSRADALAGHQRACTLAGWLARA
jgi:hypothetical protein